MKELQEFLTAVGLIIFLFIAVVIGVLIYDRIDNHENITISENKLDSNEKQIFISGKKTEFYCLPTEKGLEIIQTRKKIEELTKKDK